MKRLSTIFLSILLLAASQGFTQKLAAERLRFDFFGEPIELPQQTDYFVNFTEPISTESVASFYAQLDKAGFATVARTIAAYKSTYNLDDWLYYQLVRQTAQAFSPKQANYHAYTLYKWFLLVNSGFDAILTTCNDKVLFYVQCSENVYNIPFRLKDDKQYVCLNYHDYGTIDFSKEVFSELGFSIPEAKNAFTYRITQLPNFSDNDYTEKDIDFDFYAQHYDFKVKVNDKVEKIFANYPVVDYDYYLNIPLSKETYQSLIPELKKNIATMPVKEGVDYLMHFTRYAFLYKPDIAVYGQEKRLSPEETLLSSGSDCEDRVGLFFYLVKEIYDLPMIVLTYPKHVTIAVQLDQPVGNPISYNGRQYSVCEPTSQSVDLPVGTLPRQLKKEKYRVAYAYTPADKD